MYKDDHREYEDENEGWEYEMGFTPGDGNLEWVHFSSDFSDTNASWL